MRVSTRPALKRILVIDAAVRRQKWPNARTQARELEVVRRTIQRDIDFKRDRLHALLEFDTVRNGCYYTDPSNGRRLDSPAPRERLPPDQALGDALVGGV